MPRDYLIEQNRSVHQALEPRFDAINVRGRYLNPSALGVMPFTGRNDPNLAGLVPPLEKERIIYPLADVELLADQASQRS